jgi:hypothetical protein
MAKVNKEGQVWHIVEKNYEDIKAGDFVQILDVGQSSWVVDDEAESGDIFKVSLVDSDGHLTLFGNDGYKTYVTPDDYNNQIFSAVELVKDSVPEVDTEEALTQASEILRTAMNHLIERGITYDAKGGERSMSKVVQMFNTYKGSNLSVEDGWMFMVLLKMVRCSQGEFKLDNYEDGSAYFALAGEEAAQERGGSDDN